MKSKAKYIKDIVIQDPDTGADVDITIFKHECGRFFAVDSSYLDEVVTLDHQGQEIVNDPFCEMVVDPLNPEHKKCQKLVLKNK